MSLQNNFGITYIDRSFEQIKSALLLRFQNQVPEITDHSESNPWVKKLNIMAAIFEMIGFYIDRRAGEAFLPTAQLFASAIKISRLFDYRAKGTIAATVDLTFQLSTIATSPVVIPINTSCQTANGVIFLTTEQRTIPVGQSIVTAPARQYQAVNGVAVGVSDGTANQRFELENNVVDNSITLLVAGLPYLPQETFAFSLNNSAHYKAGLNENGVMEVIFSDGINGSIPPSGAAITADYFVSQGAEGVVGAGTINTINTSIAVPSGTVLTVNNLLAAAGGSNQEALAELKKNIPLSLRTQDRAVTERDYIDILELAPGVSKAGVDFDCASRINGFIAPTGGGVASALLISTTQDYIDDRKILGRQITVQASGEIRLRIEMVLNVLSASLRSQAIQNVRDALDTFASVDNQQVQGEVNIGDLYQTIENATGVDHSTINIFTVIPFARPINHTNTLVWDRLILPASNDAVKWNIVLISANTYELSRNESFIGSFNIGDQVVQDELEFTVNAGSYVIGNRWEFYTYTYNADLVLQEPSLPVINQNDIVINAVGGII